MYIIRYVKSYNNSYIAFRHLPNLFVFVKLEDTINGFKSIVDGEHDNIPESAFYMVGTIEEALEKSKKISKEE